MKVIFLILLLSFSLATQSQQNSKKSKPTDRKSVLPPRDQLIDQYMEMNRRLIEQFLSDKNFKQFDKEFNNLMEKLNDREFDKVDKFFREDFSQMLDSIGGFGGLNPGEFKWMETPIERILIIKVKTPKDESVDIKIKDGEIIISGKAEYLRSENNKKSTIVKNFSRRFRIPRDVDSAKVSFEKKDEDILVKFPKKREYQNNRRPVRPKKNESNI